MSSKVSGECVKALEEDFICGRALIEGRGARPTNGVRNLEDLSVAAFLITKLDLYVFSQIDSSLPPQSD